MASPAVRRLDLGWFVRPAEESFTGVARVEPVLAYLVEHPDGLLLLDTGMGAHPDVDAHYRPHRRPLAEAVRAAGHHLDDVRLVVNCHLHFDHCGGNPDLPGRPIFTQRTELALARAGEHTLPELVDEALGYSELDGEAEVLPGVLVVPTPGHTAGHQSLVVTQDDGTVLVLAGQSHDHATAWSGDALAWRARSPHVPVPPAWVDRLMQLDPRRVLFAHDHAVWEP